MVGIVPPYREEIPNLGRLNPTIHRDKVYIYIETKGFHPYGRLFNGDVEMDPSLPIYFASRVLPEGSSSRMERGLEQIIHFFVPPDIGAIYPIHPRYLSRQSPRPV